MILELCKGVHCVDIGESFQTHIYFQNFVSIQRRTSPPKFPIFAVNTRQPGGAPSPGVGRRPTWGVLRGVLRRRDGVFNLSAIRIRPIDPQGRGGVMVWSKKWLFRRDLFRICRKNKRIKRCREICKLSFCESL